MAARIDAPRRRRRTDAGIGELAVGEMRPEVARRAVALADEDAQPALRGRQGISAWRRRPRASASRKSSNGVRAADQRFLERRQRLADVDQHCFIARRQASRPNAFSILSSKNVLNDLRDMLGASHASRARPAAAGCSATRGCRARRPSRTSGRSATLSTRRRVAVDLLQAEGARPRVLEGAERRVAGGAQHRAGARKPRLEEQLLAERDRLGLARDAVARVACAAAAARGRAAGSCAISSFENSRQRKALREAVAACPPRGPRTRTPTCPACGTSAPRRASGRGRARFTSGDVVHAVPVLGHLRIDLEALAARVARLCARPRSPARSARATESALRLEGEHEASAIRAACPPGRGTQAAAPEQN